MYEMKVLAAFIFAFFYNISSHWYDYHMAFVCLPNAKLFSRMLIVSWCSLAIPYTILKLHCCWHWLRIVYSRLMPGLNSIRDYTSYFQFKRENRQTNKHLLHRCYHTILILQNIEKYLFLFRPLYQQMTKKMNQPMPQSRSVTKLGR